MAPLPQAAASESLDRLASSNLESAGNSLMGLRLRCGAGAAVANAVYNAAGVRIRGDPLALGKVLAGFACL